MIHFFNKDTLNSLPTYFFMLFCCLLNFFAVNIYERFFQGAIRVSNSSDPDQAQCFVGPDLGKNCLHSYQQTFTYLLWVNMLYQSKGTINQFMINNGEFYMRSCHLIFFIKLFLIINSFRITISVMITSISVK